VLSPLLQTTAYIMSPDGQRVLLMRRDKWPDDIHYGKYVGLGGHVEPGEDVVGCIRREITEESGLHAEQMIRSYQRI
jgi:8-oxo-dGTP diphosphatase